tara:strand:+ start:42 stop:449 length:408 start_codon:yes stop_codon:yes gene_type:complete
MVEAIGTNRGITPSVRKGIKRSSIRYNIDDGFVDYYEKIKESRVHYKTLEKVRFLDIQYFLGDDWIDYGCVPAVGTKRDKLPPSVGSKVYRCGKCRSAYQTRTLDSAGNNLGNTILRQDMFNIIPLDIKECGLCG